MRPLRSNTILYTDRWAELVAFYRDVLGLPVDFENDWFVEFVVTPDSFLSVADAARTTISAGDGSGLTLSFLVDDVWEVRRDLVRRGVAAPEIEKRWGAHVLFVHDPGGNRIEFWMTPEG